MGPALYQDTDVEEALKRLSDIRLGINLGLIDELSETDVNEMILNIQPKPSKVCR